MRLILFTFLFQKAQFHARIPPPPTKKKQIFYFILQKITKTKVALKNIGN